MTPRVLPWTGRLATLLVVVLLAWLGARVFWTFTTPVVAEPAIAVETDPSRVAQTVAAKHLFGEAPVQAIRITGSTGAAGAKLFGVVAQSGKGQPGIAIVSVQGKPAIAVREGDEIVPGVIVQRVQARSVEISQGGAIQTLTLPDPGKKP